MKAKTSVHVAQMGRERKMYRFEYRNLKDRDGLEIIDIHGLIIIKRIFMEIEWDGVVSYDVAQSKDKCYAVFKKENKSPDFLK